MGGVRAGRVQLQGGRPCPLHCSLEHVLDAPGANVHAPCGSAGFMAMATVCLARDPVLKIGMALKQ